MIYLNSPDFDGFTHIILFLLFVAIVVIGGNASAL